MAPQNYTPEGGFGAKGESVVMETHQGEEEDNFNSLAVKKDNFWKKGYKTFQIGFQTKATLSCNANKVSISNSRQYRGVGVLAQNQARHQITMLGMDF